ncbi:MAG TPA: hypothetical protein VFU56_05275 [Gaiellaceae bacterium]|nr:hypothetical protein [Gaiellaceae bacterium]
MRVALPAAIALTAVLALGAAPAHDPGPLRGSALGRTGLRLVVAAKPPIVLDVDSGRVTRLRGAATAGRWPLSVTPVGGRAAVVFAYAASQRARLWSVRAPARLSPLGRGTAMVADADSVWVKSGAHADCSLRHVSLDGRRLDRDRVISCRTTPTAASPAGLVVNRVRLIDPRTGRTLLRTRWGVMAAAGGQLLLAGPGRMVTLHDVATGTERRIRRPESIGNLRAESVDPHGHYVTLSTGDPAWQGGGDQVVDLWVLDTRTARLTHVPAMPAFVALKLTSTAWTDDGRLVLLARDRDGDRVAVWRPGQRRLALKPLKLPSRDSAGSDSFAVLR